MQCVVGFVAAFARRREPKAAASKSTSLIMNGWPLLPLLLPKNSLDAVSKASCVHRLGREDEILLSNKRTDFDLKN
jgi:hypothetical protein